MIAVPKDSQAFPESWPIRKWIQKDLQQTTETTADTDYLPSSSRSSKRRRTKKLDFNPKTLYRNEKVFFSTEEEGLVTGFVQTNDPFLQQLTVTVLDDDTVGFVRFVKYDCLLNKHHEQQQKTSRVSYAEDTVEAEGEDTAEAEDTVEADDTIEAAIIPITTIETRRNKTTIEPEVDMNSLVVDLMGLTCGNIPLTYVPCFNGVAKIGSKADYYGREFRIVKLEYDSQVRKAFACMVCSSDEDEYARVPAIKVTLGGSFAENYLKYEVANFFDIGHEVDQAYAVFASLKKAVGAANKKTSHICTLVPLTQLTRRVCGFTNREPVKFNVTIADGCKGSHRSLESVLGNRWDLFPAHEDPNANLDTLVKTLTLKEQFDFMTHTIKCSVTTIEGRYQQEAHYRSVVLHNKTEASRDYTYY